MAAMVHSALAAVYLLCHFSLTAEVLGTHFASDAIVVRREAQPSVTAPQEDPGESGLFCSWPSDPCDSGNTVQKLI